MRFCVLPNLISGSIKILSARSRNQSQLVLLICSNMSKFCRRSARACYCPQIRALKTRILQRLQPASITEPLPYKPLTLPVMPCGPGNYCCIVHAFLIRLTLGRQKTSKLPATVSYICRLMPTSVPANWNSQAYWATIQSSIAYRILQVFQVILISLSWFVLSWFILSWFAWSLENWHVSALPATESPYARRIRSKTPVVWVGQLKQCPIAARKSQKNNLIPGLTHMFQADLKKYILKQPYLQKKKRDQEGSNLFRKTSLNFQCESLSTGLSQPDIRGK